MYVFDGKNLISIFGIPYFPVLPSFWPAFVGSEQSFAQLAQPCTRAMLLSSHVPIFLYFESSPFLTRCLQISWGYINVQGVCVRVSVFCLCAWFTRCPFLWPKGSCAAAWSRCTRRSTPTRWTSTRSSSPPPWWTTTCPTRSWRPWKRYELHTQYTRTLRVSLEALEKVHPTPYPTHHNPQGFSGGPGKGMHHLHTQYSPTLRVSLEALEKVWTTSYPIHQNTQGFSGWRAGFLSLHHGQ